jgi:hypothetical protein
MVSVPPSTTVFEVAKTLAERNVGSVLVMNRGHLLGIVTDRDLVLRVLARGLDPLRTTAEAVMSAPVVCVRGGRTARGGRSDAGERSPTPPGMEHRTPTRRLTGVRASERGAAAA